MVVATDVERAVGHQQEQLIGGRPADVPGLAAAAALGLLDRPFHRDDDVPEVGRRPGGRAKSGDGERGKDRTSVGPSIAEMGRVELRQLRVVGQDEPDRCRGWCLGGPSAATIARAIAAAETGARTPSRTVMSTRHGPA